jgi:hypothetical protein
MFGEAMVSSVTGCKPSPVKRDCVTLDNGNRPGIVTVVDIQNIHNDHVSPYFQPLLLFVSSPLGSLVLMLLLLKIAWCLS